MALKDNKSSIFHSWPFGAKNYLLFGFGVLTIILGYFLMATGETYSFQSTVLSPIVLVFGYCVVIPISIMIK
tara:strand:+ start:221 stop:436 length:216 start_codon:yes stop_codon:yes gene_type:complete